MTRYIAGLLQLLWELAGMDPRQSPSVLCPTDMVCLAVSHLCVAGLGSNSLQQQYQDLHREPNETHFPLTSSSEEPPLPSAAPPTADGPPLGTAADPMSRPDAQDWGATQPQENELSQYESAGLLSDSQNSAL